MQLCRVSSYGIEDGFRDSRYFGEATMAIRRGGPNSHGDHVLCHLVAQAHANSKAFFEMSRNA
jgi:hypothetical protein